MGGGQSTPAATADGDAAGQQAPQPPPPPPQPSYWQLIRQGYQELVKAIIRPPRAEYKEEPHLGPREFAFCGRRFRRRDFEVGGWYALCVGGAVCGWLCAYLHNFITITNC